MQVFFYAQGLTGFGIFVSDFSGSVLHARSSWFAPCLCHHVGEAECLLQAIAWVRDIGVDRVIFESYCKRAVDDVNSANQNIIEFGSIISQCKYILYIFPNFQVKFIKMQANVVAHTLARTSMLSDSLCYYDYAPTCISNVIMNEMP